MQSEFVRASRLYDPEVGERLAVDWRQTRFFTDGSYQYETAGQRESDDRRATRVRELMQAGIWDEAIREAGMIEYLERSSDLLDGVHRRRDRELRCDGGEPLDTTDPSSDYRGPDAMEVGEFERPFAAGDVAEWESALYDLRELLHDLEDADLHNDYDRREAEAALFHRFGDVELALRDVWDTHVNGGDSA